MKWARVKDKSQYPNPKNKDADQDKKNDEACYVFYPDQKTLEKELQQSKNVWVNYEFKFNFRKPVQDNYERFQKRYEIFCGGYLLFYDKIVRNRSVDHILHFKWSPEKANESGKYSVKIFITPPPQKPLKANTKKSERADDSYYKKESPGGVYQNMATGDQEDEFSVDPPPPPPPPPPTMH
jgi:hypothetical protein